MPVPASVGNVTISIEAEAGNDIKASTSNLNTAISTFSSKAQKLGISINDKGIDCWNYIH